MGTVLKSFTNKKKKKSFPIFTWVSLIQVKCMTVNTVNLGDKELFGRRKIVPQSQMFLIIMK